MHAAHLSPRLMALPDATARMLIRGLERAIAVCEANTRKGEKWRTRSPDSHARHALAHLVASVEIGAPIDSAPEILYHHALDVGPGGDGLPHRDHALVRLMMLAETYDLERHDTERPPSPEQP